MTKELEKLNELILSGENVNIDLAFITAKSIGIENEFHSFMEKSYLGLASIILPKIGKTLTLNIKNLFQFLQDNHQYTPTLFKNTNEWTLEIGETIKCVFKASENVFLSERIIDCIIKERRWKTLPQEMSLLSNLEELFISRNNSLTSLSPIIENLPSLKTIWIASCAKLETLPNEFGNKKNLESIRIWDCKSFSSLASTIKNLTSLKSLTIFNCTFFIEIPKEIKYLKKLKNITFFKTKIKEIPIEITYLTNLEYLDFSSNKELMNIPKDIGNLKKITQLKLSHCKNLKKLPIEFDNLTQLEKLSISSCKEIQKNFSGFKNLLKKEKEGSLQIYR